jgi:hypothetical protein
MRRWILPLLAASALAACAGTPAPKQEATVATAGVPARGASGPAQDAAGVQADPSPAGGVAAGTGSMQVHADEPTVAKARPGYRARTRNGETVYCRVETPTGSRMPIENCYTGAQLDSIAADTEAVKDSINHTRARCVGPSCGNGG